MYLDSEATTWPDTVFVLGVLLMVFLFCGAAAATWHEFYKTRTAAKRADELRQLVRRFEELAAHSVDAQQRVAADVAELRARTASIEQILRTVD
jgi:hypothetical protein